MSWAGRSWRLPTEVELRSLVNTSFSGSTIDPSAFPATPPWPYWTSEAPAGTSGVATGIKFENGQSDTWNLDVGLIARCVSD